jgi:hypothetical protein
MANTVLLVGRLNKGVPTPVQASSTMKGIMKTEHRSIDVKSLLFGALAGAALMLSVAAATTSGNRPAWEYKVVPGKVLGMSGKEVNLGYEINRNAAQGWDFVSASPSTGDFGFAVMRREK